MLKLLLLPLICITTWLQAQEYNTLQYGPSSQIRFSAMAAFYNNLEYHNVGAPWFRSPVGIGGEFVVSYGQEFWKGFGINVGAGIGFVPYRFSSDVFPVSGSAVDVDDLRFNLMSDSRMESIFTCPILLEKKFLLSSEDRLFMNLEAGIKWSIRFSNSLSSSGGSYWTRPVEGEQFPYFEYRFSGTTEEEFLSYVFKAGILKVNKRINSFSWNLVLQYSTSNILDGTYQFNDLGAESFGTTELHNSYIGLEIIYGLSLGDKTNKPN
jgi:hypothetical protein